MSFDLKFCLRSVISLQKHRMRMMILLHIQVLQIPVCMLLLVQLPLRNHLCLMEFLIVSALNLRVAPAETIGDANDGLRQEKRCCVYLPVKQHFVLGNVFKAFGVALCSQ